MQSLPSRSLPCAWLIAGASVRKILPSSHKKKRGVCGCPISENQKTQKNTRRRGPCSVHYLCAPNRWQFGQKRVKLGLYLILGKMLDLQKRRVQLVLFIISLMGLSMTAEKFREFIGEEAASKSGKFTFLNCFDMGSGSLACAAKEGVKLYVYNIRNSHVERVRERATEIALKEACTGGLSASAAAKQAQKAGAKAAKQATRQAKRILGPILSSGWDFFEALYFEGTMTEGFLRGTGTLFGTYAGGYHGELRLGRFGYLVGSHLGSWVGGRIGLMFYDIISGVDYLLHFVQPDEENSSFNGNEDSGENIEY